MATVYAALGDTLFAVHEAGGDWTTQSHGLAGRAEAVATTPARPERVLVGTVEDGLQRSTDGGETFERAGAAAIESARVTAVACSPHDPDVVWAGTEPSAVYRSADGGETWAERPGLADLPSSSRWSFPPRPNTHHVRWIEPAPHEEGRLYVGIEAGAFLRTADGGVTWQDRPTGARRDNHTLETHPDAPDVVYTAAGDGFAVSRDGGDTWTYPQEGLDHRYCWSVAADPGDPDRLVLSAAAGPRSAHTASSAESYVYRRGGDGPWERVESDALPTGPGALRAVLAAGEESGAVYAVTDRGLARSTDGGATWTALADWPEGVHGRAPRGLGVV